MSRFIILLAIMLIAACQPSPESLWQLSSALSYKGKIVDWTEAEVSGCANCEIRGYRNHEPDGVTDVVTIYEGGQWRAEKRNAHRPRVVFVNNALFVNVTMTRHGRLRLKNKLLGIDTETEINMPVVIHIEGVDYQVVINRFIEPEQPSLGSDPLPVSLHYLVLKSQ